MDSRKITKPILAFTLALLSLAGAAPFHLIAPVHAAENGTQGPLPYVWMDGERVPLDDERIQNIVTVQTQKFARAAGGETPNVSAITGMAGDFERNPDVTMDEKKVSAQRYITTIDGIGYESYCGDPKLKGPEQAGAIYAISGEAAAHFTNALTNGYPVNSEWSNIEESDIETKLWRVYITRVAVAMANNPGNTFLGDQEVLDQARNLESGGIKANPDAYPPIMVNGVKDAQDAGNAAGSADAKSQPFEITHNRKTNNTFNPFRFEWAEGTPDGAKLIVDGNVIATAPDNVDTVFGEETKSFQIEMANTEENVGKTAAVNLVGIHNQFADKIWLMQNPGNPGGWQDIVFYIAPVSASAAFSFQRDPHDPGIKPEEPAPALTGVVIQKVDALTRENIPGALIRLRGISSQQTVTEDGQIIEIDNTGINLSQVLTEGAQTVSGDVKSTVTDGVWTLEGLPYGAYVAEEERAPENYSLLPQHTSYSFWLLPGNVVIKLNQDESTVYVDDVMVSVHEALNAAIAGIQNYDDAEGLAAELQGILDTLLSQLKVDAVFTVEADQSTNAHLVTFENFPFGQIEVNKFDIVTEEPLEGAHIRIQGYFAEGSTNGKPIDRVQVTGSDGKTVFEDLPAGQYTLTEVEAPGGYDLDYTDHRSISLTWGQTASTSFYNKPKTFLEVTKIDGNDSSKLLDGAVFRLTDPLSGEFWEGTTAGGKVKLGEGDGAYGNQLKAETVYILTEIQAPPGYVLDPTPKEVILAANNQLNIVTVKNFLKPILTIRKYDELTNEPLADASFRLWKTEGETWSELQVTDENGEITWTGLDPGIYSIQEIDEPYGYFRDPDRKEILLEGGDHKELEFFNRPRPVLTILKRDAVTGEPLADVKFRVQRLEGETIGEFLTDKDGRIELSPKTGYLLEEEIYRVTEVLPPNEYLLSAAPVESVLLKWYEPTELVFENFLKPTLIFIKRDGMSGRGISGATYNVEYESPMGGVTNMGSYVSKCGLIVIPHVLPGWYSLTETNPAPGYELPTNPVKRVHFAPGENSYTYDQTHEDLYVDPRTNPNSGECGGGDCGNWCGYLCSVLCAGNCGNPGDGGMSPGNGGKFGNITITNGKGDPIGGGNQQTDNAAPVLSAGSATRTGNMTATITFTSSEAGKTYSAYVNSGANAPNVATTGLGSNCVAGENTVTVYLTSGAKDVYIKVKDSGGNVSGALKVAVPAYSAETETPPEGPPNFDDIIVTGGTVVYLNPDFSTVVIKFGNY